MPFFNQHRRSVSVNRKSPISQCVPPFLLSLRAEGLTADTVRGYDHDLRSLIAVAGDIQVRSMKRNVFSSAREVMAVDQGLAPCTVNRRLSGWRRFCGWARDEQLLDRDPTKGIRPMREPQPMPRVPSESVIRQLLDSCDRSTPCGIRDHTLLTITLYLALRRVEVMSIRLPDFDWSRGVLKVHGKGRRERGVPFNGKITEAVHSYLNVRGDCPHDYLWISFRTGEPMTRHGWACRFRRICLAVGLNGQITMHGLRHARARVWAKRLSVPELQALLGHRSLRTTERYSSQVAFLLNVAADIPQFS
jgi:site-specific recombinase XerC